MLDAFSGENIVIGLPGAIVHAGIAAMLLLKTRVAAMLLLLVIIHLIWIEL